MSAGSWSYETLKVLALFDSGGSFHGYEVHKQTQVKLGTVYRLLDRLERQGLLTSETERVAPHLSGRPPMVIYKGTTAADDELMMIRALVS